MKDEFLAGQGTGSSYIAVLFADFGYIGVFVGNLLYGAIFALYKKIGGKSYLLSVILLYMFLTFLMTPRASYDGPFSVIINVSFWVAVGAISLFALIFEKMKRRARY